MIKNIIFDIGGVLVNFSWEKFIGKIFSDENPELVRRAAIAVESNWDSLDAGEDPDEVIAKMIACAPDCEKQIRYWFSRVGESISKRDTSIPLIQNLKSRGYNVYYLSNYSHYVMYKNPAALDFLPYIDGGVFSCDIHITKPDRRIYETLAKKYNLVPSECVFIDDLQTNIDGAKAFGFEGILFRNYEQAVNDLNALLKSN